MTRKWMAATFLLLFVTSVLGLLMRYVVFSAHPILPYLHLLHAHSHLALLGFGFLFVLGAYLYISGPQQRIPGNFHTLGVLYFVAAIAMTLSFLYQSYGPISIAFSTVVMLLAYIMVYKFLRFHSRAALPEHNPLIRWSLYWFVVSTLGIWVLGPTAAILGKSHDLYFLSIQFFLHFQFNGWFMYAALALLFSMGFLHQHWNSQCRTGLTLLHISLFLTYFLNVTYLHKQPIFFVLNGLGGIFQMWGYYLLLNPILQGHFKKHKTLRWVRWIILAGAGSLILKALLQGLAIVPSLAEVSYSVREFIVGYIHLMLLGGMALTIAGLLTYKGMLPKNRWMAVGWAGFVATFLITEIILFGHAIMTWQKAGNSWLFIRVIFLTTVPFPIFTAMIVAGLWRDGARKGIKQQP